VTALVEKLGFTAHLSRGEARTIVGMAGGKDKTQIQQWTAAREFSRRLKSRFGEAGHDRSHCL